MDRRREARISRALRVIEERFGAGIARRLRDHQPRSEAPPSSGSLGLDLAIGTGGLPRGHVTDALLLLTILASCAGFEVLGFADVPELRFMPPGRLRTAHDELVEAYDAARLLARGLRALTAGLKDNPTAAALLNEPLPEASAAMGRLRSSGGLALAHFAALRVALEPREYLPDGEGGLPGMRVALAVEKHKLGAPGGRASVALVAGRGVDPAAELLALGQGCGAVARDWRGPTFEGAWPGKRPKDALAALAEDRDLAGLLRAAIVAAHERSRAA